MRYSNITEGIFISRPNRFIANVEINGTETAVHVKNTGRCRELLLPGARIYLEYFPDSQHRRTAYDLIAVEKSNGRLINMDSQVPNVLMKEWLSNQNCSLIKPEYAYGKSRLDFYFEKDHKRYLMEVKGCTLEVDGTGYFPDAPTARGVKHLSHLTQALHDACNPVLAFVIQMDGVDRVLPNRATDPEFADALLHAYKSGVEIWFMQCHVEPGAIEIVSRTVFDGDFAVPCKEV